MKPYLKRIGAACLFLTLQAAAAQDVQPPTGTCYVIPVHGMIERGLLYVIRRGVAQAVENDVDALIFEMNTPGGRLDAAKEIVDLISEVDVPTYAFVDPDAISAGAIISLGTDHIYMAPGSRIGDAMPIMISPLGGAQEMSEAHEEKAVSYVAGLIRSIAEKNGHDPQLAEAMVRRGMKYEINGKVISKEGELLTLTSQEAAQPVERDGAMRPLLSNGTVDSVQDLCTAIGLENCTIIRFETTTAEQIARYIESLSALFLIGGLLGLYIEFKTPGFGVPGILGALLLAIWFWGHHVAGLAGMGEMVFFMLGVVLLMVEIFVIPGFGVVGLTGITFMVTALIMAMVQHYPGMDWYQLPDPQVRRAVSTLGLSLGVSFILMLILARFLPQTSAFKRLMLVSDESARDGYTSSADSRSLVGIQGVSATALRPAGIGTFGGKRLNVIARGAFIEQGTAIVIAETHGNRIVVDAVQES